MNTLAAHVQHSAFLMGFCNSCLSDASAAHLGPVLHAAARVSHQILPEDKAKAPCPFLASSPTSAVTASAWHYAIQPPCYPSPSLLQEAFSLSLFLWLDQLLLPGAPIVLSAYLYHVLSIKKKSIYFSPTKTTEGGTFSTFSPVAFPAPSKTVGQSALPPSHVPWGSRPLPVGERSTTSPWVSRSPSPSSSCCPTQPTTEPFFPSVCRWQMKGLTSTFASSQTKIPRKTSHFFKSKTTQEQGHKKRK